MDNKRKWFGAFCTLVLCFVSLIPASPLFIKLFLPFPELENAHYYFGEIETKQGRPLFSRLEVRNRYYISTADGKFEIVDGYFGDRFSPHHGELLDGAKGEVWFHPAFGILQQHLLYKSKDGREKLSLSTIEGTKRWHADAFRWNRYLWRSLLPIALFVLLLVQIRGLRARDS
ncbi:hypothetical protein [Hydrogenophaga sp.]|uniref:hypothetical protein n=1 Tax=Hydrogenophaga sp. TaxID=1904254 RepID=UPI0025BECE33|nr:hypothetical protein [Hydrogenophaga sp.]MBT9466422.1 hypothetical protein [Hydrogenophaga sp.]